MRGYVPELVDELVELRVKDCMTMRAFTNATPTIDYAEHVVRCTRCSNYTLAIRRTNRMITSRERVEYENAMRDGLAGPELDKEEEEWPW